MIAHNKQLTWLQAISDAANNLHVSLPSVAHCAMGTIAWRGESTSRQVTLRHSLRRTDTSNSPSVLWGFWESDPLKPLALIRENIQPDVSLATKYVALIRHWLSENISVEKFSKELKGLPVEEMVEQNAPSTDEVLWLGPEREFGIEVRNDGWRILAGYNVLSVRRNKDGNVVQMLPLNEFERFCTWLRKHWLSTVFGTDVRPAVIRDGSVSACRAFESKRFIIRPPETSDVELDSWWSRHAIRDASNDLPNLFIERQSDDLVFSWDAAATDNYNYPIGQGTQVVAAKFAIPVLKSLLSKQASGAESDHMTHVASLHSVRQEAVAIMTGYHAKEEISDKWLRHCGFEDHDLTELVTSGVSHHPVVGLLRSSRTSNLSLADIDYVLSFLKPANSASFEVLREFAKDLYAAIDPREPWMSGYKLAREIRKRLGIGSGDFVDMDAIANRLRVTVTTVDLSDSTIRGACVGSSGFQPVVFINLRCEDAKGKSGRRTTIAHELCHLLFDRSRMRGLGRFEGPIGDADRLIEMRANAFAIELLVPMDELLDENGNVFNETALCKVSVDRAVSMHALTWHAENLRKLRAG